MIEEMEIKLRNLLQEVLSPIYQFQVVLTGVQVYFGKTRDIVYALRSVDDLEKSRRQKELQRELVGFMKK
jgi:capping protein (actin filament) muscle Z-line, beta